jgi:hypothetical protein
LKTYKKFVDMAKQTIATMTWNHMIFIASGYVVDDEYQEAYETAASLCNAEEEAEFENADLCESISVLARVLFRYAEEQGWEDILRSASAEYAAEVQGKHLGKAATAYAEYLRGKYHFPKEIVL